MQFLQTFAGLFANFGNLTCRWLSCGSSAAWLIYLAIAKKMEPSLLLPMGFGAILVNLPLSGAITQGLPSAPSAHFLTPVCLMSCSRCCCSSASAP